MYLLACGFNGFHQIKDQRDNQKNNDDYTARSRPVLICNIDDRNEKVVDVCISWSCIYVLTEDITSMGLFLMKCYWSINAQIFNINPSQIAATTHNFLAYEPEDKLIIYNHSDSEKMSFSFNEMCKRCRNSENSSFQHSSRTQMKPTSGTLKKLYSGEKNCYILDDLENLSQVIWNRDTGYLMLQLVPINVAVSKLSCGKEHTLVITQSFQVYSWGLNSRGQLGNGDVESIPSPKEVECLAGMKIIDISAGGWHSTAISVDGDLYVWGWNESGQLGLPSPGFSGRDKTVESHGIFTLPQFIDLNVDVRIARCGSRHTCILLGDGSVMSSGWNKYGQLGVGDLKNRDVFTKIDLSTEKTVTDIYCSYWNSVFVIKDS